MISRTLRLVLALSLFPLATGFAPPHAPGQPKPKVVVGQPAPDFQLRTYDLKKLNLASLRGQVVVLNLWATWCVPCREEMPMMDDYNRTHASKGLRIFAVATEDSVPPFRLRELSRALSFPLARNLHGAYEVMDGVPTNYVIDRNGVVRYAKAAAFTRESFDALIAPLLAEPAPPPLPAPVTGR